MSEGAVYCDECGGATNKPEWSECCHCDLHKRIERLLEEYDSMASHLQAAHLGWDGCDSERMVLRKRIEELEEALKETLNYRTEIIDLVIAGEHLEFITHKQIDAAWKVANQTRADFNDLGAKTRALNVLKELGIKRCEGCKGEGGGLGHPLEHNDWHECGKCNGHGWVKDE